MSSDTESPTRLPATSRARLVLEQRIPAGYSATEAEHRWHAYPHFKPVDATALLAHIAASGVVAEWVARALHAEAQVQRVEDLMTSPHEGPTTRIPWADVSAALDGYDDGPADS